MEYSRRIRLWKHLHPQKLKHSTPKKPRNSSHGLSSVCNGSNRALTCYRFFTTFPYPKAFSQPPRPLLSLRRGTYPPPVPLPTSGWGSTAPTRRSFTKVPDHSKGRGDCLRNTVAIVYVRSAHLVTTILLSTLLRFSTLLRPICSPFDYTLLS